MQQSVELKQKKAGQDSIPVSRKGPFSKAPWAWALDRVVVRSRAQIVKPDAVFVVFLGIKWAHDIVKKNRS